MISCHAYRRRALTPVIVTAFFCVVLVPRAFPQPAANPESIIRITPAAPVLDQQERRSELAERRATIARTIGAKALLILFSAEPRIYTGGVDYDYRQENNLYYLTNLNQPRATLVMAPGNPLYPEILFMPRRNRAAEVWSGETYSPEEANQISGIREIWSDRELPLFLSALKTQSKLYRPQPENILLSKSEPAVAPDPTSFEYFFALAEKKEAELFALIPGRSEHPEYRQEVAFVADAEIRRGYKLDTALPIFARMRMRKSPSELRLLQHAIDITIEAHQRAWLAAGTAKWEYEVAAEIIYTFKRRNADHWGFPSIVGSGPNATILHYPESKGPVKPGDLLLMDIGAEYGHYTADVTRTIPVSGKFNKEQAEIYQVVYDAQQAAAGAIKPGAFISDAHRAATEAIKEGLLKLGLIIDRSDQSYGIWFTHGTSHWLGMNVHDVGDSGRRLEPGMVFTIEPGIYVRADALDYMPPRWKTEDWEKFRAAVRPAFEKYRSIGVRIEDDMLVVPSGARWMTEALPRKMSEIEDFMERGRR